MDKNPGEQGILEVSGHIFKKVKSGGLDEQQVISFFKQLIEERDTLIKRVEHLTSLSRLAEKTIADADDLAKRIKEDTQKQAEQDAKAILASAEERAQQMLEEKKAEAAAVARKEMADIKANLENQLETMAKNKVAELQYQFRDVVQQVRSQMLSQAESLKQHAATLELDFEQKMSDLAEQIKQITGKEQNNLAANIDRLATTEAAVQADQIAPAGISEVEQKTPGSQAVQDSNDYLEHVELEILPPRDKDKIVSIKEYLDGLAQVGATELINLVNMTLLKVTLRQPMDLMETLSLLPQVEQLQEVPENGQKKIQITLSTRSELERSRDAINRRVNRIVSARTRV